MSDHENATAGNALATPEGTRENHPSQPAVVVYRAHHGDDEWYYANYRMYAGEEGVWLPKAEYERLRWRRERDRRIYSAARGKPWAHHVTTRTKVPAVWTPENGGEAYETPWSAAMAERTIKQVGLVLAQIEACLVMFGRDAPWPANGIHHVWACGLCSYRPDCMVWA